MRRLLLAITLAAILFAAPVLAQEAVPEPKDYRTDNYRAPVPATLAGARVLATSETEAIWRAGTATFVDVLPRAPKPQNLPPGTIWRDRPHSNIPGSIWLPDTGYGKLADATDDYLRRGLERASRGNKSALLVIYCQENCWMSWNAAKRALVELGYTSVYWYPEGIQGWEKAGQQMAEAQEIPMPEFQR